MTTQGPDGEGIVLDVAQLEALLTKTFNVGIDAGRGKEPVAGAAPLVESPPGRRRGAGAHGGITRH